MNAPETIRDENSTARSPEHFAARFSRMLNDAAVVIMVSIGHRLELFDLMSRLPPASSDVIAEQAQLSERYVREWLAVMVTGGIVDYDPGHRHYTLDPAHAACLTRAASPDNMAVTAQFIPLTGSMEDRLLDCFRSGEGLPYTAFPRCHEVMAEDSQQTVVAALESRILPLIPGLQQQLQQGIEVLDAGCGGGLALLELARTYPCSRFTGYDLCADAFAETAALAASQGVDNLTFEARDLRDFSESSRYGLITTFDAVHDQPDPAALLRGIAGALRPDGVYLMQDIAGSSVLENNLGHPLGPLLYSISCCHCTPVSLGQGGPGLGTLWGEELALSMLEEAGFVDIRREYLPHDPFNVYFIARRPDPRPQ
ncbi:class I SAM-dependent methyltransferase [Kineobactrum salinum]|uniref:Class I SAM-dependent methyltransferase n=1 Tax=Kineobactrum salinum TaxID=2708301 RepID=A0A6C0U1J9_9GAMM|nr:class I SAM-dependent methyltransferase [Kineobactrum salinum]QIB64857.1 class I SAM-dependent methyltransferase [Kineobactrum salinum]